MISFPWFQHCFIEEWIFFLPSSVFFSYALNFPYPFILKKKKVPFLFLDLNSPATLFIDMNLKALL